MSRNCHLPTTKRERSQEFIQSAILSKKHYYCLILIKVRTICIVHILITEHIMEVYTTGDRNHFREYKMVLFSTD